MSLKQNLYLKFKMPLMAKSLCRKVLKAKGKDDIVIWLGPGFGDVVYSMAYLRQFKREHENKKVIIVARRNAEKLIASYGGGYMMRLSILTTEKTK